MSLTKVTYSMIDGASVSVLDFGAVGDGVTDDASSIQAAIDTGKDVYFPCANGETYLIGSQLVVSTRGQRLFGGKQIPASPEAESTGKLKFSISLGGDFCFLVTAHQVYFDGLTFDGINRSTVGNSCIEFARDVNTDDMDGHVKSCSFLQFDVAVKYVGRGLQFSDNVLVLCNYAVDLYWPTSGVDPTSPEQDLPKGNRALRIVNNRFHVMQFYCIRTNAGTAPYNAVLRGALISGNTVDLGEGLLTAAGDLYNTVISNNIVEFSSRQIIYVSGNVTGLVVSNNVFGGSEGDAVSSPFSVLQVTGETKDLVFSNNRIADVDGSAIVFEDTAEFLSIVGNSFRRIGVDADPIRSCVNGRDMTGVSFIGNSCYPETAPHIFKTFDATFTLTNVIAQLNNYSATGGFDNGLYVDGGGNDIQT